jgi:hypothetical protein
VARRSRWILGILLVAVAAGVATCCGIRAFNPARQSPARIRASLLESTPPGTPYDDVVTFVKSRGWEYHLRGFTAKTLVVEYGEYWELTWWDKVEAHWLFNEQNRLMDIEIQVISDAR